MSLPTIIGNKYMFNTLQYCSYSTPLNYNAVDIDTEIGAHEVLVQTKAVSVSSVDTLIYGLSSMFWRNFSKGIGCDFAGVVVQRGRKSQFQVGDEIFGSICEPGKAIGSFSEYIPVNEKKALFLEKVPDGMSFSEAASLGIVSSTAFQALKEHSNLANKSILVVGGGTSVGLYTIQLAKHYFNAAKVVATCSTKSLQRVESYGADKVIDYTDDNKIGSILEHVQQEGKFDLIVDTVRDQTIFPHSDDIVKGRSDKGVYVVLAGLTTKNYKDISLKDLLPSWEAFKFGKKSKWWGSNAKFQFLTLHRNPDFGPVIDKLWKEKKLNVVIDSQYDARTQYIDAIDRMATGQAVGKVVCTFKD